jgi:peptide/nickel transport system substrate-binding protein
MWFNLNRVQKPGPGRHVGEPCVGAMKYAWFSDARFRRAVSMAIDRDAIIRSVYFNDGMKNWSVMTPAAKEWFDPSLTGPDHDPDGARKLLAEMGLRDRNGDGVLEDAAGHPVSFTMRTNADNVMRVQMMNFIKDDLAKVGIRCLPQPLEMKALISNLREDFQYEAMLLGLGSAVPPDPGMAANVYRSSGLTHFWHVRERQPATPEEARIDSLIEANLTAGSMAERKQTYAEMTRILDDQAYFIWLPVLRIKIPVRNGYGNLHPTVIPHRVLWNIDQVFARHPQPAA